MEGFGVRFWWFQRYHTSVCLVYKILRFPSEVLAKGLGWHSQASQLIEERMRIDELEIMQRRLGVRHLRMDMICV